MDSISHRGDGFDTSRMFSQEGNTNRGNQDRPKYDFPEPVGAQKTNLYVNPMSFKDEGLELSPRAKAVKADAPQK